MSNSPVTGQFTIQRPIRYLIDAPPGPTPQVCAIALHGYGMNASEMLSLTRRLLGPQPLIASLEGPNAFLIGKPGDSSTGFHWGTPATTGFHVDVHHQAVRAISAILTQQFGAGAGNLLLLGYSQSVGLNYRFAASHPGSARAVMGLCGGIPSTWEDEITAVDCAILHVARTEDEFYPAAAVEQFEQRLRKRASDVEFHLLPGPHRFPLKFATQAQQWLSRVFGLNSAP